ncbi:hypothetical protein [Kitasatospora purpeofusca]|uniref:hypothetical protein n=1 Tax=Kitasatospora purpeofusca TaxID=67352 RepID=UPI002A5A1760|nr:hypothetical protein [Kitasatospora purpeofusca]MDY0815112.1 hypothetical protein [Kitasatospora purpeofusca]
MIRHVRAWRERDTTWWLLDGQFSWPIRAVSPGRRAAHRDVMAWCDEPDFTDSQRAQLMRRIRREETGRDDPLIGLTEAELFRRIFACDEPGRDRT